MKGDLRKGYDRNAFPDIVVQILEGLPVKRLQSLLDSPVVLVILVGQEIRQWESDVDITLQVVADLVQVVRDGHAFDLTLGELHEVVHHSFLVHVEVIHSRSGNV